MDISLEAPVRSRGFLLSASVFGPPRLMQVPGPSVGNPAGRGALIPYSVGVSTDRGSAHNAPRICGDFLRALGALTSPPASDGPRLTCVLELSAGEPCTPLVRPCAGRLGQDAGVPERHSWIERFSRSCRAWAGTATENPAPLNAARRRMIRIDGRSLGNGTAFSAVAPSQRPVCDAHQSKIFESGISMMSPGPEYLDAQRPSAWSVPPALRFLSGPIHILPGSVTRLLHTAR
jgi:hypothetical protein